jgi:hypothetical protein
MEVKPQFKTFLSYLNITESQLFFNFICTIFPTTRFLEVVKRYDDVVVHHCLRMCVNNIT